MLHIYSASDPRPMQDIAITKLKCLEHSTVTAELAQALCVLHIAYFMKGKRKVFHKEDGSNLNINNISERLQYQTAIKITFVFQRHA